LTKGEEEDFAMLDTELGNYIRNRESSLSAQEKETWKAVQSHRDLQREIAILERQQKVYTAIDERRSWLERNIDLIKDIEDDITPQEAQELQELEAHSGLSSNGWTPEKALRLRKLGLGAIAEAHEGLASAGWTPKKALRLRELSLRAVAERVRRKIHDAQEDLSKYEALRKDFEKVPVAQPRGNAS